MRKRKTSDIFFENTKLKKGTDYKIKDVDYNISKTSYKKGCDYYTLFDIKSLMTFDENLKMKLTYLLKNEIREYIKKLKIKANSVLVVGLGNKNMVADCLGDKVVEKVLATRQFDGILDKNRFSEVSCYSLGVFGKTGIETASVVKKLQELVGAELVIVVDTFVTKKLFRFNKSLQLSSCGISPGAGVDNARKYINYDFLGVPVFSMGVPLLFDYGKKDLVVMDKEIEKYVKFFSDILSMGINISINKNISIKEMKQLIY